MRKIPSYTFFRTLLPVSLIITLFLFQILVFDDNEARQVVTFRESVKIANVVFLGETPGPFPSVLGTERDDGETDLSCSSLV